MDFRAIVDEVLAGYFRALPGAGHRDRPPRLRRRMAGFDRCRPGRAPGLGHRCIGAGGGGGARCAEPRRRHRPADPAREPGRHPLRGGDAGRGLLEPDDLRLPLRHRPVQPAGPRVRAAARPDAQRGRPAGGVAGRAGPGPRHAGRRRRRGRSARFHTQKAAERMPGLVDLVDTAVQEASDLDDGALRADVEAAAGPARDGGRTPSPTWLRDELQPRATGDFRLGRRALRAEVPPRAQDGPDAGPARGARRIGLRRSPGRRCCAWPASCGRPGWATSRCRRTTTGRCAACWTPSPPTTRKAEELLDFCRAENERIEAFIARARPHRPGGRAAADRLDPAVPARLRRRHADPARARWIAGWTASSPSRPSPTTGTTSGVSRTCARTTRASCGC